MTTHIHVNLPVADLPRSMEFFTTLGFEFNLDFTNDQAACMAIEENIFVMLLTEPFFQTFTTKDICDARQATESLICLSCESREAVDEMIGKAEAAGGTIPRPPQDHGSMYGQAFEDLDGHIWELISMG